MKQNRGFTLAEVLITVAVLGIIAAITIPNLIYNYKLSVLKNQLIQTYSDLEHVSRTFYINHNMSIKDYARASSGGSSSGYNFFNALNEIIDGQYIKIKSTKADNKNGSSKIAKDNYKTLNGADISYTFFDDGYLKDGKNRDWFVEYSWQAVHVDINGYEKGPNKQGIDIFTFQFQNNGEIIPINNVNYCKKNISSAYNGLGCTYYALKDISPADSKQSYWKGFLKTVGN